MSDEVLYPGWLPEHWPHSSAEDAAQKQAETNNDLDARLQERADRLNANRWADHPNQPGTGNRIAQDALDHPEDYHGQ